MAYGEFSEVYFAINLTNRTLIKIGQTQNARRRGSQLMKEDFLIVSVEDVFGGETNRLFVESYLRARIEATNRANRIRTDYFHCETEDYANWFQSQFEIWVAEANQILKEWNVPNAKNYPIKIFHPTCGRKYLSEQIFEELEKCGVWEDHFQCNQHEQNNFIYQLTDLFSAYGYFCETDRKCSWSYFKIFKKV